MRKKNLFKTGVVILSLTTILSATACGSKKQEVAEATTDVTTEITTEQVTEEVTTEVATEEVTTEEATEEVTEAPKKSSSGSSNSGSGSSSSSGSGSNSSSSSNNSSSSSGSSSSGGSSSSSSSKTEVKTEAPKETEKKVEYIKATHWKSGEDATDDWELTWNDLEKTSHKNVFYTNDNYQDDFVYLIYFNADNTVAIKFVNYKVKSKFDIAKMEEFIVRDIASDKEYAAEIGRSEWVSHL